MGMEKCFIDEPLTFVVSPKLGAYANVLYALQNPEDWAEEIAKLTEAGLIRDGAPDLEAISDAVLNEDPVLYEMCDYYYNETLDYLGIECIYESEVFGELTHLNPDGSNGVVEHLDGVELVYILGDKEGSAFKPAYSSMDEFIAEIKTKLAVLSLPADFDWAAHVAAINGSFWA